MDFWQVWMGSIDWLHFSKDLQKVMASYWKDLDTILIGRPLE
jgi:hypothetical protein